VIISCIHSYACFQDYVDKVKEWEGGLENFTQAYKYFGIHVNSDNSVTAREWAPGAVQVYLTGEFSMSNETYLLTYLLIYLLTPWRSALLEKPNGRSVIPNGGFRGTLGYREHFLNEKINK
jgi:1,4-alpha-glucan branching enzyme